MTAINFYFNSHDWAGCQLPNDHKIDDRMTSKLKKKLVMQYVFFGQKVRPKHYDKNSRGPARHGLKRRGEYPRVIYLPAIFNNQLAPRRPDFVLDSINTYF